MRVRGFLLAAAVVTLGVLPASALADFPHVVQPGETLTSVAAVDGLSIAAIAAANGISPDAELIAGQILWIPPRTGQVAAAAATVTQAAEQTTGDDSGGSTASTQQTVTAETSYTPASPGPDPTDERVSASEIAYVADANGVPASLAEAIGWQESGWNNAAVSSAGAVGVMQIVPATWDWIDTYLTPADPLEPASAAENLRAGVLLLHQLLELTGDDYALAAAGYFQGLASVQAHGMYADTRQYVADVLALQERFDR